METLDVWWTVSYVLVYMYDNLDICITWSNVYVERHRLHIDNQSSEKKIGFGRWAHPTYVKHWFCTWPTTSSGLFKRRVNLWIDASWQGQETLKTWNRFWIWSTQNQGTRSLWAIDIRTLHCAKILEYLDLEKNMCIGQQVVSYQTINANNKHIL